MIQAMIVIPRFRWPCFWPRPLSMTHHGFALNGLNAGRSPVSTFVPSGTGAGTRNSMWLFQRFDMLRGVSYVCIYFRPYAQKCRWREWPWSSRQPLKSCPSHVPHIPECIVMRGNACLIWNMPNNKQTQYPQVISDENGESFVYWRKWRAKVCRPSWTSYVVALCSLLFELLKVHNLLVRPNTI